ncbi:MAG: polysaccharide biosynthesis/export family protein [Psychroflexus halocasei]|uniref:polysaccharide biosynthesis/export family protein n=1 Tax=Psychroflexus sp. S27 TaxID=1982757 RepID=UPI000C2B4137|nr:polysaccharide biosynthesis/export family protein [Psychroflexus sp. S27]PJX21600.1 ligand-binding protein [Psychroflexus sp. S27]
MRNQLYYILVLIFFASCAPKKNIIYYQDSDSVDLKSVESIYKHPKIQINDILHITVSALNPESVIPFTAEISKNQSQSMRMELLKLQGYLVNSEGKINYPQLGKIDVKGKTTQEATDLIQSKLSEFIIMPRVSVRIINYKFTIEGEVKKPGTYESTEEVLTLPQAIGMAGDLTINGKRNNIKVIREVNGNREVKTIDITKTDWLNSPYYYVYPNDIIYVEPNNPKVKQAGFIGNTATLLSALSVILSAIVIITR